MSGSMASAAMVEEGSGAQVGHFSFNKILNRAYEGLHPVPDRACRVQTMMTRFEAVSDAATSRCCTLYSDQLETPYTYCVLPFQNWPCQSTRCSTLGRFRGLAASRTTGRRS